MSEQQRIRKITRRRAPAEAVVTPAPAEQDLQQQALDTRMQQLDAAIEQIVGQPAASAPSEVAGERLRSRMRVLSNEELWNQFRQLGGE
jgi:hypothetical protein